MLKPNDFFPENLFELDSLKSKKLYPSRSIHRETVTSKIEEYLNVVMLE